MLQKALGERHPVVAPALNSLAHVLSWQGRHDEAAAVMQHALDSVRPSLGANHQTVAIYTLTLGAIQMAHGQPRLAEPLFREGLRVRALAPTVVPSRRRTVREDDWSLAATKSALAGALMAQKRYADAEPLLLEARRELDLSSSARADDIKVTTSRLIDLYRDWGKPDQAAAWRARAAY
jgi:tetratricopeptide (TPR) repeat protein